MDGVKVKNSTWSSRDCIVVEVDASVVPVSALVTTLVMVFVNEVVLWVVRLLAPEDVAKELHKSEAHAQTSISKLFPLSLLGMSSSTLRRLYKSRFLAAEAMTQLGFPLLKSTSGPVRIKSRSDNRLHPRITEPLLS